MAAAGSGFASPSICQRHGIKWFVGVIGSSVVVEKTGKPDRSPDTFTTGHTRLTVCAIASSADQYGTAITVDKYGHAWVLVDGGTEGYREFRLRNFTTGFEETV